jgi:hypothetical protein
LNNILYIDYLKNYVAKVNVYDASKEVLSSGTGFFVDANTLITAHHVVSSALNTDYEVKVSFMDAGIEFEVQASVLHTNPKNDVNILNISEPTKFYEESSFPKITRNAFRKREFSYAAYGFPMIKTAGHYQQGIILDENKSINGDLLIDVSLGEGRLDNYSGYSGSPVICNGQIIGIAVEQTIGLRRSQSIKVLCLDKLEGLIDARYLCEDIFVNSIIYAFNQESQKEVENNKRNKKYIPEIYVEIDEMKDYLRSFTDPILFFKKHMEHNKKHNFKFFNQLLSNYGLKEIHTIDEAYEIDLKGLNDIADSVLSRLHGSLEYIDKLSDFTKLKEEVPPDKLELFEISYYTARPSLLRFEIKDRISLFKAIKNNQVLLTEKAGQGKTNLLCDLIGNVLLKKGIPCLFIEARNLTNNDLESTMLTIASNITDIDGLLEVLNFHASNTQIPFIIVVDAINEQKDISEFKDKLYTFLNKAKDYENIRVLLTARTEYFKEKFGDFKDRCPQVEHIDGYNRKSQTQKYKRRIFQGYMQHFNIEINDIGDEIYNYLTEDYLLLRMFSEAYQGSVEKANAIPSLQHLFRYEIFERYYTYKKENLQAWDRIRGIIDTSSTYDALIRSITTYMIEHMTFSNIERSTIVDQIKNDLLVKLIDEDIIFREDIKKKIGLLEGSVEVINFTFDEFRDFCIAKYILETFDESNPSATENLVNKLTSNELEIGEGLQKYLFFASKKYPNEIFKEILANQDWFMHVYTYNIFSIDDEYIDETDIEIITRHLTNKESLKESDSLNAYLVNNLYKRLNLHVYNNLNIRLLNMILQKVDSECFNRYYEPIFRASYKDRYNSYSRDSDHLPADKIVLELKRKMRTSLNKEVVVLLSFLEYNHIYVDDFFDWCCERHEYQFISIIETILEEDNDIEKEAIKRTVRSLSLDTIEKNDSLQERWESIQEKCKYERSYNTELSTGSKERLKELLQQFELWEED